MSPLKGMITFRGLAVALSIITTIFAAPIPKEITEKIKTDAMDIMIQIDLKEENLRLVRKVLKIPPISLEECESGSFQKGDCYSKLLYSLKVFQSILNSSRYFPKSSLTDLLYDIEELITNIEEELKAQGLSVITHTPQELPNDSSEFQETAAVFLILHDLCKAMSTLQQMLASQRR